MRAHDARSWRFPRSALLRSACMVVALVAVGCDDDDVPLGPDAGGIDAGSVDGGELATAEESAGTLSAIISGEIDHARLALERASDPAVLSFAERVIERREAARAELDEWLFQRALAPREGATSARVQREDDAVRRQLEPLQGRAFERAYLDAQLASYARTIELIEAFMLPGATDPSFQAFLTALRIDVAQDAELAQQLGG